ncbi:MAG TPA: hypothetical protein VG797_08750, partial [Phycisphaerales bacterium]|nr:hypothetical protein [Phycisphaerales bacterium]
NLGATMYWVLTRRHIPTALSTKGDSLSPTVDDSMIAKPAPPRDVNPRIPEPLSDLIMQCVEVDQDKRPADMFAVAEKLDLIYAMLKTQGEAMVRGSSAAAPAPAVALGADLGETTGKIPSPAADPAGVSPLDLDDSALQPE